MKGVAPGKTRVALTGPGYKDADRAVISVKVECPWEAQSPPDTKASSLSLEIFFFFPEG